MKKLLFLLILCPFITRSQNLLNNSESEILEYFKVRGIDFMGKLYTDDDGTPFLHFSYSTESVNQDGLLSSYYYLNDKNNCFACIMIYFDIKFLDGIVSGFKSNPNLVKMKDKFAWNNISLNYQIQVESPNSGGFIIRYVKRDQSK